MIMTELGDLLVEMAISIKEVKLSLKNINDRLEKIEKKDHPEVIKAMQIGGEVKEGWE